MSQESNCWLEEFALLLFELLAILFESVNHQFDSFVIALYVLGEDDNIIEVDETYFTD